MRGWIVVVCLAACDGGGTGPSGGSCELAVTLSGALDASFTGADIGGCAAANDLGGDPIIVFYPENETVMRLDIDMPAAAAGMPGENIEGGFAVVFETGSVWDGDCAYTITRWEGTGGQQRIQGSGTCEPLAPDGGSVPIMTAGLVFDMF